jgi:phospholipid/cholesterol/gamma-HCH transport system substrate-binding protein
MDHRVPKAGLVLSIVCTALAALTFVVLNQAFEGPSPVGALEGDPYELRATFADTEALPTKQPVLVRGVPVGKVTAVDYNRGRSNATVTFTVDEGELDAVHADATVTIGERTLLGDAYLNLDPGTERAGTLDSGARVRSLPSVDFDEAFDFLDARGRRHLASTLDTLDRATRSEESGAELNATVGELGRTVGELRDLAGALRGQEEEIAALVSDSSTVVGELGAREAALRRIVVSGRATLERLAANADALERGVAELPGVLAAGAETLRGARPLLAEARPLVRELRRSAPDLATTFAELGPLASDTVDTVRSISGLPTLRKLLEVVVLAGPAIPGLEDSVRNLVPLLRFTAERANGITSFFANMASATAHGDSDGAWARFAILFEPGEVIDVPAPSVCAPEDDVPGNTGVCHNAYPKPGDALDPEPYEPGSYPRLRPFDPPPPK